MISGSGSGSGLSRRNVDARYPDWDRVVRLPYASSVDGVSLQIPESMLPCGSVLVRRWHGRIHLVKVSRVPHRRFLVTAEGGDGLADLAKKRGQWRYVYDGKRWRSLSTIATAICGVLSHGYYRYGAAFFGLVAPHKNCQSKGVRR